MVCYLLFLFQILAKLTPGVAGGCDQVEYLKGLCPHLKERNPPSSKWSWSLSAGYQEAVILPLRIIFRSNVNWCHPFIF